MNLGPHVAFIVSAYAASAAIVAALLLWVALDRIRLRRTLEQLEGKGITRRSERTGEVKP